MGPGLINDLLRRVQIFEILRNFFAYHRALESPDLIPEIQNLAF